MHSKMSSPAPLESTAGLSPDTTLNCQGTEDETLISEGGSSKLAPVLKKWSTESADSGIGLEFDFNNSWVNIYSALSTPGTAAVSPVALPDGNIANIDGKIEQAMDLVKSHLMYAVREEIDVLRAKIVELERKVLRLETENLLLRECVPEEILAQLPPPSNQSSTSTTVNYSI